jgi:hypothetical protein
MCAAQLYIHEETSQKGALDTWWRIGSDRIGCKCAFVVDTVDAIYVE